MEIFLKNRLSFNYEIIFLPCNASLPLVEHVCAWEIDP